MSRHRFTTRDKITWIVGFDPTIASYFAQRELGDGNLIDVAGVDVGDITTAAALQARLDELVSIPPEIARALDGDGPTRPTWLRPDLARDRITATREAVTTTITTEH